MDVPYPMENTWFGNRNSPYLTCVLKLKAIQFALHLTVNCHIYIEICYSTGGQQPRIFLQKKKTEQLQKVLPSRYIYSLLWRYTKLPSNLMKATNNS